MKCIKCNAEMLKSRLSKCINPSFEYQSISIDDTDKLNSMEDQ